MAEPTTYPVSTIAKLLDLQVRRVQQLSAEGIIPRANHGRYELVPAVQGYIRYLRERSLGGDAAGADQIGASRALLLRSRARMATLEADQFEGTLLKRPDVERAWVAVIYTLRARMLAIPHKTAQALAYLDTPTQIASLLTAAVSEALDEISAYPVYVADRGGEPDPGERREDGAAGGQATPETDAVGVG